MRLLPRKIKILSIISLLVFSVSGFSLAETLEYDSEIMKFKIEQGYKDAKLELKQVQNDVSDMEFHLDKIAETKLDLTSQLENINNSIIYTEEKLEILSKQSSEAENEISLLEEKIEIQEIAFAYQKSVLSDYIEILYLEEQKFFSGEDENFRAIKLLLSEKTVGDNLKNINYFNLLNETAYHILDKLNEISYDLEVSKANLLEKRDYLNSLREKTIYEKEYLIVQKNAKEKFLATTQGQEKIYLQLLEQSKIEQNDAVDTVKLLSQAISDIEKEISETGSFDSNKYQNLLGMDFSKISEFRKNYILNGNGAIFDWPLDPFKGLSAYFRDPGYAGHFGVRHNAIDIPAYQGTLVRSTADGVVYKTKDNGYGYNYIIVAHADGFSSVYGHISKILVSPGEVVSMGSIIGLSGGMPGTLGAGYMTTGPHLHFEMLKEGEYVDPLYYLPLFVLSESQMEWLPQKYKELWRVSNLENSGGKIDRTPSPILEENDTSDLVLR